MTSDQSKGLYEKYRVERTDGKPVGQCIVLEVKDPNTWAAIGAFAATVRREGYVDLADDLLGLIDKAVDRA